MRASAMRAGSVVRVGAAQSVGEGMAIGVRWLVRMPGWWWASWLQTARRLAGDPAAFVNHR